MTSIRSLLGGLLLLSLSCAAVAREAPSPAASRPETCMQAGTRPPLIQVPDDQNLKLRLRASAADAKGRREVQIEVLDSSVSKRFEAQALQRLRDWAQDLPCSQKDFSVDLHYRSR